MDESTTPKRRNKSILMRRVLNRLNPPVGQILSDPIQAPHHRSAQSHRRPRHGSTSALPHSPVASHSAMNPAPPIVFLVRQQAKSLVAINELQDRVRTLEDVQEGVFNAVHDLQDHLPLTSPLYSSCVTPPYRRNKVPHKIAKSTFEPIARYTEMPTSGVVPKKKDDFGKGDENKQDSGVDSDCQNPMSLTTTLPLPRQRNSTTPRSYSVDGASAAPPDTPCNENEDELSLVLDEIALRGAALSRKVRFYESQFARMSKDGRTDGALEDNTESGALIQRCKLLEDKLQEFVSENDYLGNKTLEMQTQIEKLQFDKSLLEERMETVLKDRQHLEKTIHSFHSKIFRANSDKKSLEGSPRTIRKKQHEESKMRVQSALKEKEPLELQKQLMLCIVENEVLCTKAELCEKMRLSAEEEAKRSEFRLRERVRQLMLEKQQVSELAELRRKEMDQYREQLALARSKMDKMEEMLSGSRRQRVLAMSATNLEGTRGTNQPLSITDYKYSRPRPRACQSLPLTSTIESSHYIHEIQPFENTSGYLNITCDPGDLAEILEQEEDDEYQQPLCSTPRLAEKNDPSHQTKPLMDVWATNLEPSTAEKQTNTSLMNRSDLDSICSEFDPLSSLNCSMEHSEKHQNCYVDSLDHNMIPTVKAELSDDVFGFISPPTPLKPKPKQRLPSDPQIIYSNRLSGEPRLRNSTSASGNPTKKNSKVVGFRETVEQLL